MRRTSPKKLERGQAIILIAAAAIGLVALIGLVIDGGTLLLEYGRLKRAIDAASLSAALQYREGYQLTELEDAAEQFLILNQTDVFDVQVDTDDTDASLVTNPRRKLVRVTASRHVHFGFLSVIGIYQTDITASSIGEAASVDVILVLDGSASMAYEGGGSPTKGDHPADDPSTCNAADNCQPFRQIKDVAIDFVDQMYFPYDRVAIITFDRQAHLNLALDATDGMTGTNAYNTVVAAIQNLTVFEPAQVCPDPVSGASPNTHCINYITCPNPANPLDPFIFCRTHPGEITYAGLEYPLFRAGGNLNPSSTPSSNIGDALWLAGEEFGLGRQDSLWVVIVLAGGPANTGCTDGTNHNCSGAETADGRVCPSSTYGAPYCRDGSASTRHAPGSADYDADDYARDAADFLANPLTGQGAAIFSIGLGDLVIHAPAGDADAGQALLQYAATVAGDESGVPVNHGLYFYAPGPADLLEIFTTIAENIATRLSQ